MRARTRFRFVFPVLAVAALVLGFWGFAVEKGEPWHVALMRTLQLFGMEGDPAELGERLSTTLAAALAPLATLSAAIYLLGDLLRRRLRLLSLRWRPVDELFLGAGPDAAAVAARKCAVREGNGPGASDSGAQACAAKIRVAGLDQDEYAPLAAVLATAGTGFVVSGDARSADELRRVRALSAGNVWIMAGDDSRNLEIARTLLNMAAQSGAGGRSQGPVPAGGRGRAGPRLLVSLADDRLLRAGAGIGLPPLPAGVAGLEWFNLDRLAARVLLETHPPLLPPLAARGVPAAEGGHGVRHGAAGNGPVAGRPVFARRPHIAIVGGGRLALALAEQAISQWLLDDHPGQALRLSLIGTEAPTLRDTLLMRHPVLASGGAAAVPELAPMLPLAELVACRADETELGPADWRSLQADVPFDAVYVVPETDLRAGRAAARMLALREAFGARAGLVVVTAFTDPADAAHPLPFEHRDHHWFRVHDRCLLRDEPYPGATADLRAALVDHAYRQASSGRAAPAVAEGGAAVSLSAVDLPAAIEAWLGTDEAFRWSSRCAGDHYPVKLACLEAFAGERLRGDALRAAIARHRDWLTRLEHRRFVVERLFDGWLPRPPDTPTEVAKAKRLLRLNDTLKPFELLDAGIADIDTRIVDAMADILALQEAGVGFPAAGGARR